MLTCKLCSRKFPNYNAFGIHLSRAHGISSFEYHTKVLGKKIPKCPYCRKDRKWKSGTFISTCGSRKCLDKKRYATMKKLYGVPVAFQSDEIKERCKNTWLKNYGVSNPMKSGKVREKHCKSIERKYGKKSYFQCDTYRNKKKKELEKRFEGRLAGTDCKMVGFSGKGKILLRCGKGHEVECLFRFVRERIANGNGKICPICHSFKSDAQMSLVEFVRSNYSGEIRENDRSTLPKGKELDIYLPKEKLAFEFNGLHWHTEKAKGKRYHALKSEACERLGIRLIHIWEDDWTFRNQLVKSRIRSFLRTLDRIDSKKCELSEIDRKEALDFLEKNHMAGKTKADSFYGLRFGGLLVSVMAFGCNGKKAELKRYCSRNGFKVSGGMKRLFSAFLKKHPKVSEMTCRVSRDWSRGETLEKLGFVLKDVLSPRKWTLSGRRRKKPTGNAKDSPERTIFDSGSYRFQFRRA